MDNLRIDSHKLIYHVDRVSDWLKGKNIYPIFLDVSPTSACNHRCCFCGLDFAHKKINMFKTDVLVRMLKDCGRHKVKSIMYAGEGEPLLHKDMAHIIRATKENCIDAALNTNGVLMDENFLKNALKYLTWMRVSIDAGTKETYSVMHGTKEGDFDKVIANLKIAVGIKKKNKLKSTIGTQFLLLKENHKEAETLAGKLKRIGVDYLIIKPYSKHPLSLNDAGTELDYTSMLNLDKKLSKYSDSKFKLIFRRKTMEKRFKEKPYKRCLGAPFWAYISSSGDIYPCHTYLNVSQYSFGNLNEKSFSQIWNGQKRKRIMNFFYTKMDAKKCRELCRLDEINAYLWQLKYPHEHVNFI